MTEESTGRSEARERDEQPPRIEEGLRRRLETEGDDPTETEDSIDVVVRLSADDPDHPDSPEATRAKTKQLIQRSTEISGEPPEDYHVFSNLQSLIVRGHRPFVKALLDQPEVAGAVENRTDPSDGSTVE